MKQVDLSARLKPGKQTLTVAEAHGAAVGFQASFRYNVPEAAPAAADPLTVDLAYDRTELAVGEEVHATATVRNATGRPAPMVMVELPVPPGFAPSADDFAALVKPGGKVAKYQVGPRSVLLYLTGLGKDEALTAAYRLKATMPVKAAAAGRGCTSITIRMCGEAAGRRGLRSTRGIERRTAPSSSPLPSGERGRG